MKLLFLFAVTCACAPTAWAQSGVPMQASVSSEVVASVQEPMVVGEAPAPSRLRDVFQTAATPSEEPVKPYRLTSEERMRLREQLRGQFAFEVPKQ